jgi:hypothetical protein
MSLHEHGFLGAVVAAVFLAAVSKAEAQTVVLLKGAGIQPASVVVKGAKLAAPTVIEVPPGALVVLEESWPSDQPGYPCESWVIVSGNSYPVRSLRTDKHCPISLRGDELARARRGEPLVAQVFFYGDAPYDRTPPEDVRRSHEASRSLQQDFREASQEAATPSVAIPPPPPPSAPPHAMSALMENQGFMGGTDYRETVTASAIECSSLCASENVCLAMTYIIDTKKCYLKNAPTELHAAGGMVSAVKR